MLTYICISYLGEHWESDKENCWMGMCVCASVVLVVGTPDKNGERWQ